MKQPKNVIPDEQLISAKRQPWELSPDHRTVYANVVMGAFTPYDCQLNLGRVRDSPSTPDAATTEHLLTLIMTPAHMKAFIAAVQRNVRAYELAYGEIELPAAVVEVIEQLNQPPLKG